MKNYAFLLLSLFMMSSSLVEAQSKKEIKEKEEIEQYSAMKELVEIGKLSFEANAAFTQKGRRIDLTTNPNSLIIDGKISEGDIPYFGVVQVASYNSGGGIEFKNETTKYTIKYNDKKKRITIKFSANNKTENFNLILTISGSGFATLSVNSNQRNTISYNGKVKALEKTEE